MPHTHLAVTGSVTPEVLAELLGRERQEDGFAARLLISWPLEVDEQWTEKGVEPSTKRPVIDLMRKLAWLLYNVCADSEPKVVKFSKKGKEAFTEVMEDHFEQKMRYELNDFMRAHWAKMKGYTARLCLIIHLVRYYDGETKSKKVDAESVYMAAALAYYFKAHAARFCGKLNQVLCTALYDRIIKWANKHNKQEIETRDIYTAKITPDAPTTRAVLDKMVDRDLGKWKNPETKQIFVLSPTQHSASQQNQSQWEMPVIGDNNKWLNRLRKLRKPKRKTPILCKVARLLIPLMLRA